MNPILQQLLMQQMPRVGLLGSGSPMPRPNAPALPPMAPRPMSLKDRILSGLFPIPAAVQEMMTPDEIAGARNQGLLALGAGLLDASGPVVGGPAPSLGQALAQGIRSGQAAAQQNVGQTVQLGMLVDQQKQAMQMRQLRQRVAAKYPAAPGESREQTIGRLRSMMAELVAGGDMEGAGRLGEYLKSVDNENTRHVTPQEINLGDEIVLRDPVSGRIVDRFKRNPTPRTTEDVAQERRFRATLENQILGDFQQQTRGLQLAAQGYTSFKAALDTRNPMQPIALLYSFARIMDPESVVREGEIATLTKLGALDDRIQRAWEMAKSGNLPTEIVNYLKTQAEANIQQKAAMFEDYRRSSIDRGVGFELDPERLQKILPNPYTRYLKELQQGTTGAGSADNVRRFFGKSLGGATRTF